ncbi:SusC/RagA family TonB-linked outer membrane protein [Parabacteroides faecis]|uniref:TonB-linked SusC/RagA family outer membrane protein n=1 Tax=Parabacteroides faecis TaxID=1217282 RepID=A0ABR6KKD5_9BACT|nr:TonB-dependent receptor [Parabacteroides faecis]MBB4621977.1 TonB-linked SusC/RagA family outer membrane protein [Parabacteroides faecis]
MKDILAKRRHYKGIIPLFLCLLLFPVFVFAQKVTVNGQVKDHLGEPVIGANIAIKGTTTGAITDLDGMFSIPDVEVGATVDISFIGYLSQSVKVSGNAPIFITLVEDNQALDEVVVIGYGVQKKSVVTASIARVSADDLSSTAPVRVDNALKGLASGVQVTTTNGQPGAAAKIRIRGTGTINNSDPLYIVDGMAIDGGIDYLNPNDIASIEVLKDAASGAVYGARAANGVVLVTTKSGKEGKVRVTYDFSFGWQRPWKERDMLNATQYATLMNEASNYAGEGDMYQNPSQYGIGTNWQKETFNYNAPVQNHQVSVSGASEKVNYFLSLGYYNQEGIVGGDYDRSNYKRMTMRTNSTYTLFDESKTRSWLNKIVIGVNAAYSRINNTTIETNSLTGSALGNAMFLSPIMGVYADDESALYNQYADEIKQYGDLVRDKKTGRLVTIPSKDFNEISNPLGYLSLPGEKFNSDKFVANFFAELTLWDNLKFKTSYGTDLAFWGTDGWSKPYYLAVNSHNDKSKVWSEMNRGCTWQLENILTYDKTFGAHSFSVVLGQSAKKYTGRKIGGSAYDMIAELEDKANLDFTSGLASDGKRDVYGGMFDPSTLASYFGRISYNYNERYMLQFTVRRDGSSNFGPNNKWATFPSVSLGWNITNESFMAERPDWLTSTKLRLSWGKNGNENIGAFRYTANVATGNNYVFGDGSGQQIIMGSKPSGTPNADLRWEESEQYDAGLDFGFLNNSLTISADYFNKRTNGMLKEMSIPSYLGESKPWGNVGSMENSGVEVDLGYKFNTGDWNFKVGGNISYLKNKLINLGNSDGFEMKDNVHQLGNVSRAENGEVYPFFYGYKTAGIFQNQAQIDAYVNNKGEKLQPNAEPGDVIFIDTNKDGAISDTDRTKIGKGTPDWTYGLNFQASWKDIDFSMLIAGSIGNDIFDATRRIDLRYVNLSGEMMDRWHGEGTSNTVPRFTWANNNDNYRVSDLYIKNGSYMRLKNIQLGYTLPKDLTSKAFISSLRIYVAAENLLTLTGYKGFDPEISYDASAGIDRGIYPQARTFTVGLNLNF